MASCHIAKSAVTRQRRIPNSNRPTDKHPSLFGPHRQTDRQSARRPDARGADPSRRGQWIEPEPEAERVCQLTETWACSRYVHSESTSKAMGWRFVCMRAAAEFDCRQRTSQPVGRSVGRPAPGVRECTCVPSVHPPQSSVVDTPTHTHIQVGRPLTWEESLEHLQYVREHGVLQFLNTYDALKTLVKPELKWGEEMEFGIFKVCYVHAVATPAPAGHLQLST